MQTPQSLQPGSTHAQRVSYSATKSLAVPPECAASQRFVVARFQFKQTTVGAFMKQPVQRSAAYVLCVYDLCWWIVEGALWNL